MAEQIGDHLAKRVKIWREDRHFWGTIRVQTGEKMLRSLAKNGFDTAENEQSKIIFLHFSSTISSGIRSIYPGPYSQLRTRPNPVKSRSIFGSQFPSRPCGQIRACKFGQLLDIPSASIVKLSSLRATCTARCRSNTIQNATPFGSRIIHIA